jgi:hypothetical protein
MGSKVLGSTTGAAAVGVSAFWHDARIMLNETRNATIINNFFDFMVLLLKDFHIDVYQD